MRGKGKMSAGGGGGGGGGGGAGGSGECSCGRAQCDCNHAGLGEPASAFTSCSGECATCDCSFDTSDCDCDCSCCKKEEPCELCGRFTYSPVRAQATLCKACAAKAKACAQCLSRMQRVYCPNCYQTLGKSLLQAAQCGCVHTVRRLLEGGADVNFTYKSKWTALHRATAHAHAEVVSVLLQEGADFNATTYCGFTPLHMAAFRDYCGRCVSFLLNAGAYVDVCNDMRKTPLHYAAEAGNEAAVRALMAAGANKCLRDAAGMTPMDVAECAFIRRLIRRS